MKDPQNRQRTLIRRTVVHDLPQGTVGTDKPDQVATTGGIAVRTDLKAGLLTALLLQQQAAAGAAGGGGAAT